MLSSLSLKQQQQNNHLPIDRRRGSASYASPSALRAQRHRFQLLAATAFCLAAFVVYASVRSNKKVISQRVHYEEIKSAELNAPKQYKLHNVHHHSDGTDDADDSVVAGSGDEEADDYADDVNFDDDLEAETGTFADAVCIVLFANRMVKVCLC
jgi:hypothetical protein